jgi:signal transduction histidine kinase/HPt (histidine-containing phosphotransfer) domain-containing protein
VDVQVRPTEILLVEDSEADARLLLEALREAKGRFHVRHVETLGEAIGCLTSGPPCDTILLDLSLPDSRGIATLERLIAAAPHLPILVLTGLDDEATAIEAIRKGAQDYLVKGEVSGSLVVRAIRYARQRKQMEEELKKADAAKNQFLANISHELRTPMNSILGMIELTLGEALSPKVRDCLQTAKESADTLLQLLNDLLDFSRIEARAMDLESVPFSPREIVEKAIKTLGMRAGEKGLDLVYEVPDDVPDRVVGDPLRLRQILLNLVGNAIKFTSKGEVAIRVAVESRDPPEVCLRFSVADTGIGIAPEEQHRIFSPFTQADASTTRRHGGSGLGLAIASSLVGMFGGRIWVESRLGQGSTFHFTVRLAGSPEGDSSSTQTRDGRPVQPEATRPAAPSASAPARPLRILLVEDTPANQKLVVYLLTGRGHEVELALNGQDALELFRQRTFDLVLMDVQMPVMDGFQATAAMRGLEQRSGRRVPIVAMTAHARKGDAERCLAAGMDAYVSKPIQAGRFIDLVESLAGRSGPPQSVDGSPAVRAGGSGDGLPAVDGEAVFQREEALASLAGQDGLFRQMVDFFFEEWPQQLAEIEAALTRNEATSMARAAHRLKGTVVYLGAKPLLTALDRVEQIGGSGDLSGAAASIADLRREARRLAEAVTPYRTFP